MTTDQQEREVHEVLLTMVRSLVDRPEAISIHTLSDGNTVTFRISVDPTDVGKLIGMGGRTARALRTILGANGARLKRSFALDIVELTPPASDQAQLSSQRLDDGARSAAGHGTLPGRTR